MAPRGPCRGGAHKLGFQTGKEFQEHKGEEIRAEVGIRVALFEEYKLAQLARPEGLCRAVKVGMRLGVSSITCDRL